MKSVLRIAFPALVSILSACSGGGGADAGGGSTPAPTVTLSASPTSVSAGGTSTLSWSTTHASACTASGSWNGAKAVTGSEGTGALSANATYTLSCTGEGGSGQASTTVTVSNASPAPTVTLGASPTIVASGGSSTLTWSTANATSCTASGGWSGAKATSGTQGTGALAATTSFTLNCTGGGGSAQSSVTVTVSVSGTDVFPLRVEAGKRYLIDAQNRPFLVQGDAPWSLIARLTRENVDLYLETRRQQGFNTVLTNLIEHQFTDNPPRNAYGNAPFTTAGDFGTPNAAYFDHAEYVIAKANEKGMLVLLAPAYMGFQGGNEGWYSEMSANGATKLRAYGQWVANRFKSYENILWVQGGDYDPPDKTLARAVANGIRDVDTQGLQTFHGGRGTGALEFLNTTSDPWLGVNNIYTDANTVVNEAFAQYAGSSMPFFLIEAGYEGNDVDGAGVRAQAYQAVFSGSTGQLMGNFPVWYFGNGWQAALDTTGARTLGHLPELFTSTGIAWQDLAADTGGAVLTSGPGSGIDRAVAARASDGSAVVVFAPVGQSLTIDLTKLAGPRVNARWYDPTNGSLTTIGAPVANAGSRTFAPPAANAGGADDFVLVLQSQP
jgi:hypothetical protein